MVSPEFPLCNPAANVFVAPGTRRVPVFSYYTWRWQLVPDTFLEKYHPGASYDLRSTSRRRYYRGAGQQCTYDSNGKLITHGVGAGTADRVAPTGGVIDALVGGHGSSDVQPAEWAWRLDKLLGYAKGDGPYFKKYLEVRPINNGKKCPKNP